MVLVFLEPQAWWLLILRILTSPQLTHEKSPSCRRDLVSYATSVKMLQLCACRPEASYGYSSFRITEGQAIFLVWLYQLAALVLWPTVPMLPTLFVGSHCGRCGGPCWRRLPVWLCRVSQGLLCPETDASRLCSIQCGRRHVGIYASNACCIIALLYALKMLRWVWQMWLLAW